MHEMHFHGIIKGSVESKGDGMPIARYNIRLLEVIKPDPHKKRCPICKKHKWRIMFTRSENTQSGRTSPCKACVIEREKAKNIDQVEFTGFENDWREE